MSGKININVQGGSASFGNVVQLEKGSIGSISTSVPIEAFKEYETRLSESGADHGVSREEIERALKYLGELATEAKNTKPEVEKGSKLMEAVRKNADWAYPIVKDFVAAAWPALAGLLGIPGVR
jgi:hypothetical protein